MSELSIRYDEAGYWLRIDGQNGALINLGFQSEVVRLALDEACVSLSPFDDSAQSDHLRQTDAPAYLERDGMMKRVWKPLDVKDGLRLYQVKKIFSRHPEWNDIDIVAATSPREAAHLIQDIYKDAQWTDGEPIIKGCALNVYQPKSWWDGIEDDFAQRDHLRQLDPCEAEYWPEFPHG